MSYTTLAVLNALPSYSHAGYLRESSMPSKRLSPYKWRKRKKECFERDGYRCKSCGGSWQLDAHHTVKRSKGGSDDLTNLITLCRFCHNQHHSEFKPRWSRGLNKMREEMIKEKANDN